MTRHIDVLGLLFVLMGVFELIVAALVGLGMIGGGAFLGIATGDPDALVAGGMLGVMGLVVSVVQGLVAIPAILVGMGIRRRQPWARIGGLVLGAIQLTSIPIGTMLGVYAFLTLLDKDVAAEFGVVG